MPEQNRRNVRRRRRRRGFPWLFTIFLLLTAILVFALWQNGRAGDETMPVETEPVINAKDGDTITIAAAGDILITPEVMASAVRPDGSYDFSQIFLSAAPLLMDADLTVANLEANIGANPDPAGNLSPRSLLTALSAAGVDLLQTANTNSVYNGLSGLTDTIDAVEQAGMKPVGTFASQRDFEKSGGFTLVECKGFKVAFVAFTKGLGNLRVPEGAEYCVNLLYEDYNTTYQAVDTQGILKVLRQVQEAKPDITIALLHWGSEYNGEISDTQQEIQALMYENGVDAILGTHSHLVGRVETDNGRLTAYSLGNLLSSDDAGGANQGVVLKLKFRMNGTEPVLEGYTYAPVYLATAKETGNGFQILDTEKTIDLYLSNYVDRVSKELYETLLSSRDQVDDLIHGVE